ncbi:MAG: YkgJ family cysteine cluster protein [Planctomycetes bacterium]|nr:YkgJ family cysteine cluster protein [Planctomycetota bacterium]
MTRARSAPRRLVMAKGLRFQCRQCGDCCRDFPISLSPAEVARYDARDWTPVLGQPERVHEYSSHRGVGGQFLRRKPDGTCLFLGPDDLCEMHRHLGEAEKPLACRLFPFSFLGGAADGRPVVGASFACSAIAAGDGEPIVSRRRGLEELLEELEAARPLAARGTPLRFDPRHAYGRAEVELVLDLLVKELEDAGRPLPERLLAAVKFLALVSSSAFPSLEGDTARKLVGTFAAGIHEQVQRGLLRPRAAGPSLPERLLFRQVLALTVRRDTAALLSAGVVRRTSRRVGNLLAGLAFMAGNGAVTCVGRDRRVTVGDARRRAPPADLASPEADGALTRYLVAHLSARTLLDPSFQVPEVLPALGLLFRQVPLVLLLARAACLARGGEALTRDDYAAALRTADWNFGRVPWTAGLVGRVRARLLGDVEASLAHLPWCGGASAPADEG